jgi:hypothetical protein
MGGEMKAIIRRAGLVASVLAATACTRPNHATCADDYCDLATLPFCDIDGSLEGEPNTCIAVDCTPGELIACRGETEITCNEMGTNYNIGPCDLGCDDATGCRSIDTDCEPGTVRCGATGIERCVDGEFMTEPCAAGCVETPTPRCAYLEPTYLPDVCDEPAVEAHLDLGAFNTNVDSECNGGVVAQTDAPDICIVRYSTITIPDLGVGMASLVRGDRVLALVADHFIDVVGILDVSADAATNGPGVPMTRTSGTPGSSTQGNGGAGFATAGAAGGSTTDGGGGSGGVAVDIDMLEALVGGFRSPPRPIESPPGGGGGGAATLIACRGTVTVSGTIDAGGGGGDGGRAYSPPPPSFAYSTGGAGGGSGGLVVLQGLGVTVTGKVFANGGAGGTGKPSNGSVGAPGSDGLRQVAAAPAPLSNGDAGRGGAGGFGGGAPGVGIRQTGGTAGGGGGSVGAFYVYTPDGVVPGVTPAEASPGFRPSRTTAVR